MPSLHVALPAVVVLWYGWRSGFGKLMLAWTALIALTVVYSGDHYVDDVIAGLALASVVYALVRAMRLPLLRTGNHAPPADARENALPRAA
jgi:membrane-associated phospholipid phosphatase